LPYDDAVHAAVGALCLAAQVDGLRADLVMLRAARALAAWEQAERLTVAHVQQVADLVLLHRRKPGTDSAASAVAPSPSRGDTHPARHRPPPMASMRPTGGRCRPSRSASSASSRCAR
jgi:magnesium chelatase subunit I